jgi:hypothetical protein
MKIHLLFVTIIILSNNFLFSQEKIDRGRISGYMFGDYFYNAARDTGITSLPNVANGGEKDQRGFQLRRIYFTYDYDISESFSTRFRLEADQSSNTSSNKIIVYVKDAFLQWKNIFKGSDLIFGIHPTPAYEISEGIWGNRFLEKTIMDLRGIVSSRDLGVSLKGKLNDEGIFKYWLMVGNNSASVPEVDKYNRIYAHIQYSPIKQITATAYADLKFRPDINNPASTSIPPATLANNDLTYALFLGYKEKDAYTFGVEGYLTTRQNGNVSGTEYKDKNGIGVSTFASYNFSPVFTVVGRYDYFDPNSDSNYKGDSRNWFIFSLNYKPDEKVTISPNIIVETYESIPNGPSIDASITPRITLFYTFL